MERESSSSVAVEGKVSDGLSHAAGNKSQYPRIGGMLILVAIGLIISLLQNAGHFLANLNSVIKKPLWEKLTDSTSLAYHFYWKLVLIYDLGASSVILFLNILMLVLFFRKKKLFPSLIVVFLPAIFILGFVSYYFSGLIPAVAESKWYAKQGHALIIRFIILHLWIPYFLLSNRVKSTFIR